MKQISVELLQKYWKGQCTPEEIYEVEEWLSSDDNLLKEDIRTVSGKQSIFLKKEIWDRLERKKKTRKENYRVHHLIFRWSVAACLFIFLGGITYFILTEKQKTAQRVLSAVKSFTSPAGTITILTLPDSSIIHMLGGSTIEYPEQFDKGKRTVNLSAGEIFLEVVHNSKHPFVLKMTNSEIEVLGTKFNVSNSVTDSMIAVTLTDGSIRFTAANNPPKLLMPGEQLTYNKVTKNINSPHLVNTSIVTGWVNKILQFDNQSVINVLKRLEVFYGVEFVIKERISPDKTLTGKFENMSLQKVLSIIEFSTGLQFEIDGKTITVRQ